MPRLAEKTLLKSNMELWLNNELISLGFYSTVNVAQTDMYGRDISRLISWPDPSFADDCVWQSAFKEWVHESGVSISVVGISPPVIASGVTVNGVFYSKSSSGVYAHNIDYPNGRIIFNSPVAASSVVQAAWSFKEVGVGFSDEFNNESEPLIIQTSYKDNPLATGVLVYPAPTHKVLPRIFIDLTGRTSEGYELGWKSLIAIFKGSLHIWTNDSFYKDLLEERLAATERDVIKGINFNTAPFPLTYLGDKNPLYTSYASYASTESPYFWHRIYLDDVSVSTTKAVKGIELSRVDFEARIYPTM